MNDSTAASDRVESVEAHLSLLQAAIERMAANSASTKAWCVTLVSALLVIVADKGKAGMAWLALPPTAVFLLLDAYYLALERRFRASHTEFVRRLHRGDLKRSELFVVAPAGNAVRQTICAIVSFSVWPAYTMLFAMIYAVHALLK